MTEVNGLAGFGVYTHLLHSIPIITDSKTVVETGLSGGASTKSLIRSLSDMINPEERELHTYEINVNQDTCRAAKQYVSEQNFKSKWILHEQDSVQGGREWNGPKIDFLFLDSDHGTEFVYQEVSAWASHMSDRGVIAGDDVVNFENHLDDSALGGFRHFMLDHPEWRETLFRLDRGFILLTRV